MDDKSRAKLIMIIHELTGVPLSEATKAYNLIMEYFSLKSNMGDHPERCKPREYILVEKRTWIPVSDPLRELPKDKRIWVTYKYVDDIYLVDDIYYDMTEWSDNLKAKNAVAYMYYYSNEPEPYIKESDGKSCSDRKFYKRRFYKGL